MRSFRGQRGIILLTVLVILVIAALAGTTVMYLADAELGGTKSSTQRVQARALAWSGVQAALSELASEREDLLLGATPRLTPQWELFRDEAGRRYVVRLRAVATDDLGEQVAASESARLDVNTATAEMLAKTGLIDEDIAGRIVAGRGGRGFESTEDLLRIEGVTPELLLGFGAGDAASGSEGPPPSEPGAPGVLGDVLTVFNFDPNIQSGVTEDGVSHRGKLRVNLNAPWSEELAGAIADRFGPDAVQGVKNVFESGATFKVDADIVKKLRELGVQPDAWPVFLDAFTTSPDPFVVGRIDLNAAPAGVLACVPGIDTDAAAAIEAARAGLDEDRRSSVAWPVIEGLLSPEQFQTAVDHLTTRSMVWRVQVEGGWLPDGEEDDAPVRDPIVVDAVLDVSSQRPRVAYLRDVTLLPSARAVYATLAAQDGDAAGAERPTERDSSAMPESPARPPARGTDRVRDSAAKRPNGEDAANEGAPEPDPGDDVRPEDRPEQRPSADTGKSETGRARGAPTPRGGGPASAGRDRRIGRWTAGGGR